jgi:adenosylmethionine-8-amino-7-oxononanoate aminotransferase
LPIGHGYTYSGHPVSAAVALECLRLYQEGGLLANGVDVGGTLAAHFERLKDHPLVGDVRSRGCSARSNWCPTSRRAPTSRRSSMSPAGLRN